MVIPIDAPENESETISNITPRLKPYAVGKKTEWVAETSGVLLLKLNEASHQLFDNSGVYKAITSN